jgi:hypothetical protein
MDLLMRSTAIVLMLTCLTVESRVEASPQQTGTAFGAPTVADFQKRLEKYLELRKKVEDALPPLTDTSDPKKLATREHDLGVGIQAARLGARQGEIFSPALAKEFRRVIQADVARRTQRQLAGEFEEVPRQEPQVNALYPTTQPLATLPPLLLAELPTLPEALEYRFMGRSLILRDVKANLIVDFVPSALHRRSE